MRVLFPSWVGMLARMNIREAESALESALAKYLSMHRGRMAIVTVSKLRNVDGTKKLLRSSADMSIAIIIISSMEKVRDEMGREWELTKITRLNGGPFRFVFSRN